MTKIIRSDKWYLKPNNKQLITLQATVNIYRVYVRRLISIVNLYWTKMANVEAKQSFVEKLIHQTKDNPNPKYGKFFGFGSILYKFPSYLRRAAINDAIGHVSSFQTRYRSWQSGIRKKKTSKPPILNSVCGVYPDLYKNQCIKVNGDYSSVQIKVFQKNDWVWETINVSKTGARHKDLGNKQLSPTLIVNKTKAYLSVPFQLKRNKFKDPKKYCGVDIGINTTAVCSIVDESGVVHDRKFIHDGAAIDKRDKHLSRISRKARLTKKLSKGFAKKYYRKAANINKHLANITAKQIINFAILNDAKTVVIENLRNWKPKGKRSKKKPTLKQRFHGWIKSAIADRLEQLGEELGIKIVLVSARGTSSFAYDGTGMVERFKNNYAIGKFKSGKIYNIDLSASYNIAARYIAFVLKLANIKGKLPVSQSTTGKPRSRVSLSTLWAMPVKLVNRNYDYNPSGFSR
jgi:IS605 OrfB family transposase